MKKVTSESVFFTELIDPKKKYSFAELLRELNNGVAKILEGAYQKVAKISPIVECSLNYYEDDTGDGGYNGIKITGYRPLTEKELELESKAEEARKENERKRDLQQYEYLKQKLGL